MTQQRRQNITSIVKTYSNRLYNFIKGRVPNAADAEDILQEVWYQFSNVVDREPIEQVSGWLFQVARNRITDNYRKSKPDSIEDYAIEDDNGGTFIRDLLAIEPNEMEDHTFQDIFWEVLFEALDELPDNQREVFVWNELENQTFQEIADRTGIKLKTLISRKRYAVQHLRQRLQTVYNEFLEN